MKKKVIFVLVLILVVIASCGLMVYSYLNSFSKNNNKNGANYIEPKDVKLGQPFNVLLLGVDIGTVGSKNSPKRSDTMMIFHYEPDNSEVSMVSVPRDTRVKIDNRAYKINAANEIGGASMAVKTVEKLLGIDINYYAVVDYSGFRKIIDRIGGIDVVVPYEMDYDAASQDLHIHFKKGEKVHLDGEKAEEFVRWRKNNDGTGFADGDMGRIRVQQDFVVKILQKLKTPSGMLSIPSVASVLPECIETNMKPVDILSLSKEIAKINLDSIQKYTIQGEGKYIGDTSYFIYSPEKSRNIVSILGGKDTAAPKDKTNVDNSSIRIQVMNASGISGAAARVKQELESRGYTVAGTGNITGVEFSSSYIIDKTLKRSMASQVSSELDIDDIVKDQDSLSNVDVVVILGLDKADMVK